MQEKITVNSLKNYFFFYTKVTREVLSQSFYQNILVVICEKINTTTLAKNKLKFATSQCISMLKYKSEE